MVFPARRASCYSFSRRRFFLRGASTKASSRVLFIFHGLVSLTCFPLYVIGGILLCKRGEAYMGNLYMLFGALFGGMMGLVYIAYFFDGIFGWGLEYAFLGIPTLLAAIVFSPSLILYRFAPSFEFATWVIVTFWLFISGVESFAGGYSLFVINKWCALISGLCVSYLCAHELLRLAGSSGLPMGKPLFHLPKLPAEGEVKELT